MPKKRGDGPVSTANASMLGMLGLKVEGDLGMWTVYTDRYNRKKWFLYSPPTKPPTPRQLVHRLKFKRAQANWMALSDEEKANLERACIKTSMCLTGQNLFISAQMKSMNLNLQQVGRQAGIELPEAHPV